jgi:hypothetical protein
MRGLDSTDIETLQKARMIHDWQPMAATGIKAKYIHVPGKPDCIVRIEPMPKGYLWQHGKQYGFAATLDLAKQWAETAREFWPRKLPS